VAYSLFAGEIDGVETPLLLYLLRHSGRAGTAFGFPYNGL